MELVETLVACEARRYSFVRTEMFDVSCDNDMSADAEWVEILVLLLDFSCNFKNSKFSLMENSDSVTVSGGRLFVGRK